MKTKAVVISLLVIVLTVIFQSTVLNKISLIGVKPDLVLIIVIILSNYTGKIKGQLMGFTAGLVQDVISLSPFGFNILIKSVIGYLGGGTAGKIFLDPLVVPAVFVLIGTLLKAVLSFILLAFFSPEKLDSIFTFNLMIEIGLNVLITPFIYFFLKLVRIIPNSGNLRVS